MINSKKQVFYIGGKSYSPETAIRLCQYKGMFGPVTLYRSQKGTFFIVDEGLGEDSVGDGPEVKIVSEGEAHAFMDEHPAQIDTDAYDRVFGVPEEG